MSSDKVLVWFERFIFVSPAVRRKWYPLFVHRLPFARLASDAVNCLTASELQDIQNLISSRLEE